ncbi:Uncharacterized mitochondrial protein AtMg00310 [Linum perenne]
MDETVGRFRWAGDGHKKSIHWVSKEKVQMSKSLRGMGFKNFEDFNCAFLAKMGWRVLTQPESLWVRLLKSLYFPKCEFMEAKKGSRPSWLWSSILTGRDTLAKGCRKSIGNGQHTWMNEPWRPDTPDFRCDPPPTTNYLISEFIRQPQRVWDGPKLRIVFSEEVFKQIEIIPFGPPSFNDR